MMGYKVSRYNINVETGKDTLLMYNTSSGAIVSVDKENYLNVKNMLENPNSDIANVKDILIENGFIVHEELDEVDNIKKRHEDFKKSNNSRLAVTLMPAEHCNCKCPYCFVFTYRNKVMSKDIYDNAYDLLINKLKTHKGEEKFKFVLEWFGGEPTLQLEEVIQFTKKISEIKEVYDFDFTSNIVTNGYLLSYDNFKRMLDAGVKNYQLTFDGDKEHHDKLRILKNNEGTFDVILKNIKDIRNLSSKDDKFQIDIRINFLKSTTKSVYNLIDKLADIIDGDKRFSIYCRPIYNFETTRDDIDQLESDIYTIEEGIRIQTDFAFYIKKKLGVEEVTRIFDPLPKPTQAWCRHESGSSYIIGANGDVFMCDTNIGDEFSLGKLSANGEIKYNNTGEEWKKPVFELDGIDKCLECKTLPICVGGCRRVRITEKLQPCFWTEKNIIETIKKYYAS